MTYDRLSIWKTWLRSSTTVLWPTKYCVIEELNFSSTKVESSVSRMSRSDFQAEGALPKNAVLSSYARRAASAAMSALKEIAIAIVRLLEQGHQESFRHPRTGLCLSALHDRAYDQGLITVLPDFTVRVSERLKLGPNVGMVFDALLQFDGKHIRLPEAIQAGARVLALARDLVWFSSFVIRARGCGMCARRHKRSRLSPISYLFACFPSCFARSFCPLGPAGLPLPGFSTLRPSAVVRPDAGR